LHNHPSGDPAPSQADVEVTERIERLGTELGIPLLDHVIIGDQKFYSFRQEGILT
jgi:DNA repair protein RadC